MICSHADDDGESETRVEARLITALGGGGSDSDRGSSDKLREGDKVEADYRDRGKFYPGKITRDRGDETYDISYDDGEREIRVAKRLIRKKRGSSRSRSPSRSPRGGGSDRLREGDAVEADYRGRGRYYPGKISRDRGDDTYDIAYDDGDFWDACPWDGMQISDGSTRILIPGRDSRLSRRARTPHEEEEAAMIEWERQQVEDVAVDPADLKVSKRARKREREASAQARA